MKKWYDSFLKEISRLGDKIFLMDKYDLLKDENFYKEISELYYIFEYDDEASFYLFEEKYKDKKILIISSNEIKSFSIGNRYKKICLEISAIFPELDLSLMKKIDISYFQTIFNDYKQRKKIGILIPNTRDFILQSIWNIDLGKLHSQTENLKIAFSFLVDEKKIPEEIVKIISNNLSIDLFKLKNTNKLIKDWISELLNKYNFDRKLNKAPSIDFSDPIIQYYVYKLELKMVILSDNNSNIEIQSYNKNKPDDELDKLKLKIKNLIKLYNLKIDELTHEAFNFNEIDDYLTVSRIFCEILYHIWNNESLLIEDFINLEMEYQRFDKLFRLNLFNNQNNNYNSLFIISRSNRPYTLDKIIPYLHNKYAKKIALIVMDGMSYDEWFILQKYLSKYTLNESSLFSIIPSVTAFSRTAIFSGKTPIEFMDNNYRFNEEKEFYKLMSNLHYDKENTFFGRINLKDDNIIKISKNSKHKYEHMQDYDFIGLICNLFDDLSHEEVLVKKGKMLLYKNIDNHIKESSLIKCIEQLYSDGYKIAITTDHGNIFCKGNGVKFDKNLQIDEKSKRCLLFNRESFAEKITSSNPINTFTYRYSNIPENLFLVFPIKNECFINKDKYTITHGGISPEELVVPLVIIE